MLRKLEIHVDGLRRDESLWPLISPDGTRIAYVAKGSLWVRSLDDLEAIELTGTEGARLPFWSPDSSQVGFHDDSHLWRMPATGGARIMICVTPRRLADVGGVAWTADGRVVFTTAWGGPFWEVPVGGGEPRAIMRPDPDRVRDFHSASALPDGSGVLSVLHRRGTRGNADAIVLVRNGSFETILEHPAEELFAPVYANGYIVYGRAITNVTIWAAPFSLESQEVTGPSFLVAESAEFPSVSSDGTLVYAARLLRDGLRPGESLQEEALAGPGETQLHLHFTDATCSEEWILFCRYFGVDNWKASSKLPYLLSEFGGCMIFEK